MTQATINSPKTVLLGIVVIMMVAVLGFSVFTFQEGQDLAGKAKDKRVELIETQKEYYNLSKNKRDSAADNSDILVQLQEIETTKTEAQKYDAKSSTEMQYAQFLLLISILLAVLTAALSRIQA